MECVLNFSSTVSSYTENLSEEAKRRYLDKIAIIDGTDPMCDGIFGKLSDKTPPVDACDLLSYSVVQTSFVTAKQFKTRKGLEAYNQWMGKRSLYS